MDTEISYQPYISHSKLGRIGCNFVHACVFTYTIKDWVLINETKSLNEILR